MLRKVPKQASILQSASPRGSTAGGRIPKHFCSCGAVESTSSLNHQLCQTAKPPSPPRPSPAAPGVNMAPASERSTFLDVWQLKCAP